MLVSGPFSRPAWPLLKGPNCRAATLGGILSARLRARTRLNALADNSIAVVGGKLPQTGSVDAAIVQTAVYDAVNAICGFPFTPYAVTPDVKVPAMMEAAVAAATHDVLIALYPAQVADLDQQYAAYLNAIRGHTEGKLNGIAVGKQAAAGIFALQANDGRNAGTGWTPPPPGFGIWQPTPPGFLPPATPWLRLVTPLDHDQSVAVPSTPATCSRQRGVGARL